MTDAITSFAELKKFRAHLRANLKALLHEKLLPGGRLKNPGRFVRSS
jgi:hypothetical protein